MSTPSLLPRTLLIAVALAAVIGMLQCRKEASPIEPVQKMAYQVKPAIVRINAYASAEFHYSPAAVERVAKMLRDDGYPTAAMKPAKEGAVVKTGAGGSGSGFIIHPSGLILTSGHVVELTRKENRPRLDRELLRNGAIAALIEHFPIDLLRSIYRAGSLDPYVDAMASHGTIDTVAVLDQVELSNGSVAPFSVRIFTPPLNERGSDVALLEIHRKQLPTVRLGDSDAVRLQDPVWVIGYPSVASSTDEVIGGWLSRESDLEATFNPGTITSFKRDVMNTQVFQTNAAIYQGNSGGPAVDRNGDVVGISTWGHTDAEQIKFLVPINVARSLLEKKKIPFNVEGEFQKEYRKALDAAWDGDWITAREHLVRANTMFPNSPDLIRFLQDADNAIGRLPFWRAHLVLTRIAIVVLVLGIAGVSFLLFRNRSASSFAPPLVVANGPELLIRPEPRSTDEGHATERPLLGRFTILNGDRAGERLGLAGSGIRIGRETGVCEIVLQNPKVSRLHAEVVLLEGRVLLIDRNSSNGTFVNDQRIDRHYLDDGDIIYFGGRNAVAVAFHA
ncbi:MAG: trypsin-like peptidase domain-containing protein [Thermoanaerobaculia bacterium]